MASNTSIYPAVRAKLTALEQKLAETNDVIMDGRDIGTCVLPNAQVKIYLTAEVSARARRRYEELVKKVSRLIMRRSRRILRSVTTGI